MKMIGIINYEFTTKSRDAFKMKAVLGATLETRIFHKLATNFFINYNMVNTLIISILKIHDKIHG